MERAGDTTATTIALLNPVRYVEAKAWYWSRLTGILLLLSVPDVKVQAEVITAMETGPQNPARLAKGLELSQYREIWK